ncbi:hypothetical protein WG909_04295 [Peptostreptococcaceae bacterium AGR-M142]
MKKILKNLVILLVFVIAFKSNSNAITNEVFDKLRIIEDERKVWTIEFSNIINEDDMSKIEDCFEISDDISKRKYDIDVRLKDDKKTIEVIPNFDYEEDTNYSLKIDEFDDAYGNELKKGGTLKFRMNKEDSNIEFEDKEIERIIKDELDLKEDEEVTQKMLFEIERLIIKDNTNIKTLVDLEKLKGLRELDFRNINFSNLTYFPKFQDFEEIVMENCDLRNEDLYININNIDKMEFNRCKVFNMNILSKIEDLRKLELYSCEFDDFYGLENSDIKKIVYKDILLKNEDSIEALDKIDRVVNLDLDESKPFKILDLSNMNIEDISDIPNLDNVYDLDISHNSIKDITELSKYKSIERLDISYNDIEDITPLFDLDKLEIIQFDEAQLDKFEKEIEKLEEKIDDLWIMIED